MLASPIAKIKQYQRYTPIALFFAGFLFDAAVLHRVDATAVIIHQALYIFICAALITVEFVELLREVHPPKWLSSVWKYRDFLLHFLLGTLLNGFTIFYFKSASSLTAFAYVAVLVSLLVVNEFLRFGRSQAQVHFAMLSLCLISYLACLVPILLGFLGDIPFALALGCSVALFSLYYLKVATPIVGDPQILKKQILLPYAAVTGLFTALYFLHVLPPVPLSVKYLGIYHVAEKRAGQYVLSYTRPYWKIWQNGDQQFIARPGDPIIAYAQIFCPTRFRDQLQVRWMYKDERLGWQSSDAIPVEVAGGREEGYRITTKKNNYQPGDWKVQVETRDGKSLGSIGFTVELDASTDPREFHEEVR